MSRTERGHQGSWAVRNHHSLVQCNNGVFLCPGEGLGMVQGLSLHQNMRWRMPPSPSCTALLESICLLTLGVH